MGECFTPHTDWDALNEKQKKARHEFIYRKMGRLIKAWDTWREGREVESNGLCKHFIRYIPGESK